MKKFVLWALIIVIVITGSMFVSAATNVLEVDFILHDDDTIDLINIENSIGTYETIDTPLPYQVQIRFGDRVMYKSYFDETFWIYTEPMERISSRTHSHKIPYRGNVGTLVVLHNGAIIFEYNLSQNCNYDFKCSGYENRVNCPFDCTAKYLDRIWDRVHPDEIRITEDASYLEELRERDTSTRLQEQWTIIAVLALMLIIVLLLLRVHVVSTTKRLKKKTRYTKSD